MGHCENLLRSHPSLRDRREASERQIRKATELFAQSTFLADLPLAIFCAGSLARREVGAKSDLDVFVTADDGVTKLRSKLSEYTLFAELIGLNKRLGLPEFSNDGQYLKIYFLEDLKRLTGSPKDDSENVFTARMLLLLESEPLLHADVYERHLRAVVEHYYRDSRGKRSFRPLFLLNDLLRYWRTLCLNYEERRHDPSKPWRKKNVNLKFSRMVTVFGTVLPLVVRPDASVDDIFATCRLPPLERLATAIDHLNSPELIENWPDVLDTYETFLAWKEDDDIEHYLETADHKDLVRRNAEKIATFLQSALTNERIPAEFRRYLVL